MNDADAGKLVDEKIADLAEHFEAVIILCSRDSSTAGAETPDRMSQFIQRGRGNWFAQRGMLREVLENDMARSIAIEHANHRDAERGDET